MANSRSLQQAVRFALATVTAAAGVSALHAQEAPAPATTAAPVEEVVVTGSRLQTPNELSISPITTVSAADIQATGLTRVEDVLNNLPQVFAAMNSTTSNGADGTASVDLRGLGPQRTLVLVDSLRLGPGNGTGRNFSDINQIPAALIERIEVLTGGASAVYGADAVAGVVNFILNTHFEGVKIEAGYHFQQHNNDNQAGVDSLVTAAGDALPSSNVNTAFGKNASVLMGSNFNDNKGNVTAYVTYDNQGPALQSKFDYSACSISPVSATQLGCVGSGTAAKNGAGGHFYASTANGHSFIHHTVDGLTGQFRPLNGGDDYNFGPLNYYQTPNIRWTAGTFVNYDINSHVNVYMNVMYMRNEQQAQIAASGNFFQNSFVPCADPLLTAQERSTLCTASNLAAQGNPFETYNGVNYPGLNMVIGRRNVEGGPRISDFTNDSAREVIGVKGDFGDPQNAWTYNAYAQHAQVDSQQSNENYLSNNNIDQALNVLPGPTGPVCGGPSSPVNNGPLVSSTGTGFTVNSKCAPWNLWVPNGVTPAALAFLSVPLLANATTEEYVADASVTGDLGKYGAKLPWADSGLQLNIGAEWRQESSSFLPDYLSQQGSAAGSGGATPPVSGGFTVKEVFTEMRLPIAQHQPFAEDLSLDAGYRYSKYSEGFDTNTYKIGAEWAPIRDIRFRGGYQRAVRAPNVGELFIPQAVGLDGSIDPCAAPKATATTLTNGVTLAQCEATGVKPGQFGNILPDPANQYNGLLGGNPNLQPEKADSYTIGWIVTPRFLPNFTWSVDYFNIKIDNVIGAIGGNTILLDCISQGTFCNDIHRDPGGSLWRTELGYVQDLNQNLGELKTQGIDVQGTYRVSMTGLGSLLFSLQGTKTKQLQTTPVANGPSWDCVGLFGATCGAGNPKWKSVFNTTWSTPWDALDVNVRWRYIGPSESEQTTNNSFLAGTPYLPLAHIPAYSYFDLSATFNVYKNVRLELGVNNITDKVPPLVVGGDCSTSTPQAAGANCNGNTFPGVYDAMGRYLFAHITAQF
jgi:iron complex outermembrane receptor protein